MLLTLAPMSTILTIVAEAVEELLWETRRLFRTAAAAADRALGPLGLTAGDRALLEFLAREPGPISVAELARRRSVSRQHIHQSLDRMPNPAWIERVPDPHDARSMLLRLTADGRAVWKKIRRVDRTMLRRIARHVNDARAKAAARTLREIRRALGDDHD
jgi:DNA-binding MarR family transcriptional regulator